MGGDDDDFTAQGFIDDDVEIDFSKMKVGRNYIEEEEEE